MPQSAALTDHQREAARARAAVEARFRAFIQAWRPTQPYFVGPHTSAIMTQLERATRAVERGERCYLIVNCPPRHGKSDLASRRYGPWHLLRNPQHNVILATYGQALANDMSRDARSCARRVLRLSEESQAVAEWRTAEGGAFFAVGLGSAITGRGGHLLIIDDYLKGPEQAQSSRVREQVWEDFRSELFTRLSPEGHAVVVVANRWHQDDLVGRILQEGEDNEAFPQFEHLVFPARDEDTGKWLFPELFTPDHYNAIRAAVGSHWWQALYQQDPQPREGRLLEVGDVRYADEAADIPYTRGWDLAYTEAERTGQDPDYTVGTKAGYDAAGNLWIADVVRGRWKAPQRDRIIRETARKDGREVRTRIEAVAAQRDTKERLSIDLGGGYSVEADYPGRDKVARATPLEPLFQNGQVVVVRGEWNDAWLSELRAFPDGDHDDQVDSLVIAESDRRPDTGTTLEVW